MTKSKKKIEPLNFEEWVIKYLTPETAKIIKSICPPEFYTKDIPIKFNGLRHPRTIKKIYAASERTLQGCTFDFGDNYG